MAKGGVQKTRSSKSWGLRKVFKKKCRRFAKLVRKSTPYEGRGKRKGKGEQVGGCVEAWDDFRWLRFGSD